MEQSHTPPASPNNGPQPIDTAALRKAHRDFFATTNGASFGTPPAGEWDAEHLLAHIAAANYSIASTALAVAAGQHPAYDNRSTLDPWHLRQLTERYPDISALIDLVRASGEALCTVAEQIPAADLDASVPALIVSNDEAVLDATVPLRTLIDGVGQTHLPLHTEQLKALIKSEPLYGRSAGSP
jgi:hypothetical protein